MKRLLMALAAVAAGAAAMYYLDPESGRRRRAAARDQAWSASRATARAIRGRTVYASGRMRGWMAGATAPLREGARPRSDRRLRERIRAQLGRLVRRPRDVEVVVNDGDVSLRGRVPEAEREALLQAVTATPGVRHVHDRLKPADVEVEPWGGPTAVPADARHRTVRTG